MALSNIQQFQISKINEIKSVVIDTMYGVDFEIGGKNKKLPRVKALIYGFVELFDHRKN